MVYLGWLIMLNPMSPNTSFLFIMSSQHSDLLNMYKPAGDNKMKRRHISKNITRVGTSGDRYRKQ